MNNNNNAAKYLFECKDVIIIPFLLKIFNNVIAYSSISRCVKAT